MKHILFIGSILTASLASADQGVTVSPRELINLNDVSFTGQATNGSGFKLDMRVSCFGTNLRSVSNPLASTAYVSATGTFRRPDESLVSLSFNFPASATERNPQPTFENLSLQLDPPNFDVVRGSRLGNRILIEFRSRSTSEQRLFDLQSFRYYQSPANSPKPGDTYVAYSGTLSSATPRYSYSADNNTLNAEISFPGAAGFCGGFYSPLMLFFGDKRPAFTKSVAFALRPEGHKFYWPEPSDEYAFLALDKNANGKVDSGEELFGQNKGQPNGFESLRELDSNKDGKISAADQGFKDLNLWFDKNANGKTEAGELVGLDSKKIQEISLSYEPSEVVPLGDRAEYRQHSKVKTDKGAIDIIDVWLGVAQATKEKGKQNGKTKSP